MFEGDKETFAQAVRNECMCGPDGDLSDWDRTWNEMWQSISQQENCPDKESVEALLEVMLDTRYETDDMDEERSEYLSGLIDRWRSDKEAKQEAVDTISGGCKIFCVNGYLAGDCRAPRSEDDRSKESRTQRVAGQPAG